MFFLLNVFILLFGKYYHMKLLEQSQGLILAKSGYDFALNKIGV